MSQYSKYLEAYSLSAQSAATQEKLGMPVGDGSNEEQFWIATALGVRDGIARGLPKTKKEFEKSAKQLVEADGHPAFSSML